MTTENNKLLTVEELARHIQVHRATIRRWIKEGKLLAIKLGEGSTAHYRISEKDATAFLNRLAASLAARNGNQAADQVSRKGPGHGKRN